MAAVNDNEKGLQKFSTQFVTSFIWEYFELRMQEDSSYWSLEVALRSMIKVTRGSTRRAQTLSEVDHYPHITQYRKYALMNVGPLWKTNPKGSRSLSAPWSGLATTIISLFSSFTHLRRFGLLPKCNKFFLVLPPPPQKKKKKNSCNPFITSWVVLLTNRQTDWCYWKITSFAKEVIKDL